jgi:hypothetical protein
MRFRVLLSVTLAAAGVALIAGSVRSIIVAVTSIWAGDYLSYAAAGRRVLEGGEFYAPFQLAGPYFLGNAAWGDGYVYPPVSAWLAVPFSLLEEPYGFSVFTTLAGMAFALLMFRIARVEGLDQRLALLFALVMLLSPPAIESLATGQANTFVAIGIALSWLYPRASGYIAIIGGLLKLFPLAGLAWAIRNHAPVVRPLVMLGVVLGVSVLIQGGDTWRDFLTATANGRSSQFSFPTPPRHFLEPVVGATWATLLSLASAGVLMLISIRIRSDYAALALISLAMILPSPDWYVHYLIVPLAGVAPWFAHEAARLVQGRNLGPAPAIWP